MRTCILHVTDREFPQILQLNHDSFVWSNQDEVLLDNLVPILGRDVVDRVREFDECRMQPHHSVDGLPRVEEDTTEPAEPHNLLA
jgi:hypothetical protein